MQNGATLILGGTNYAAAVFNLKAGTTLDLGGQTVTVKQVKGAGRVVNGTLVGTRVGAGTVIAARGRHRWLIEIGFKTQKRKGEEGFGLENTFCADETASRAMHLLML